ncbi:hypothetical protein [Comamonas terrigena]|uniref:hypothetical protein n=1 Tax=Comamonas terrigena TaxID=32013 RepID=UPI0028B04D93|nr:hypothetical protein [Comamonas terrigena]
MSTGQKKARIWRAHWWLSAPHQQQELLAQSHYLRNLVRRTSDAAPLIARTLAGYLSMAIYSSLNAAPLPPHSLHEQQVKVGIVDTPVDAVMSPSLEQPNSHTVNNAIPLTTSRNPEVGLQTTPEAKHGRDEADDSPVGVEPLKAVREQGIWHLIGWVFWLFLCLFGGFFLGLMSSPHRNSKP